MRIDIVAFSTNGCATALRVGDVLQGEDVRLFSKTSSDSLGIERIEGSVREWTGRAFDECDAIFGKRSEVKDAHDRNANVEVAYLLQQIEEHDGVCIMATNLIGNIDAAFMRRITYVVHFPFPDPAMRQEIYRRTVPKEAPVSDDVDWAFLAEKFELSGGHIKNIVLSAAFLAALEGEPIGMSQLLRAAVGELKKNEIVVVREELREYADLLDG